MDPDPQLPGLQQLHLDLVGSLPTEPGAVIGQLSTLRRLSDLLRAQGIIDRSTVPAVAHIDLLLAQHFGIDATADRRLLLLDLIDKTEAKAIALADVQAAYRRFLDRGTGAAGGRELTYAGLGREIERLAAAGAVAPARLLIGGLQRDGMLWLHRGMSVELMRLLSVGPESPVHEVPKELNFIWFGNRLSPAALANVRAWIRSAGDSDWKLTLWTQAPHDAVRTQLERDPELRGILDGKLSVRNELEHLVAEAGGAELLATYKLSLANKAYNLSSDIARYAVLIEHGGVYADVDLAPGTIALADLAPMRMHEDDIPVFGPLLRDMDALQHYGFGKLPLEEQIQRAAADCYHRGMLGNHFIVAPPNSRYLRDLITAIPEKTLEHYDRAGWQSILADKARLEKMLRWVKSSRRAATQEEAAIIALDQKVLEDLLRYKAKAIPETILRLQAIEQLRGTEPELARRAAFLSGPRLMQISDGAGETVHGSIANYLSRVFGMGPLRGEDYAAIMDPAILAAFKPMGWLTAESDVNLDAVTAHSMPGVGSRTHWRTHLKSWQLRNSPDAMTGRRKTSGIPVRFRAEDVLVEQLVDKNGKILGVTFFHRSEEVNGALKWGRADSGHDKVIRTRPGDSADETIKKIVKASSVSGALVEAPWHGDYDAEGGDGPVFLNAHGTEDGFQIRLKSGTTLVVDGTTYAKLVAQLDAVREALRSNPHKSFVLLSCEVAAGDAAPDFVEAMRSTFPDNPIHASAEIVWTGEPRVRGKTVALTLAAKNGGWVTFSPDGTRRTNESTRYQVTAPASTVTPAATAGALSHATPVTQHSVPVTASVSAVAPASAAGSAATAGASSHAELATGHSVPATEHSARAAGWLSHLKSWLHNSPDVLKGRTSWGSPVKFRAEDVIVEQLADKNGKIVGVTFLHESKELDRSRRWARADSGHDKVVRMRPGESFEEAFKAPHVSQALVEAPWRGDYAEGGDGPVFLEAHGAAHTFQIRLKSGTTLSVYGTTYAKLVAQLDAVREALRSNPDRSILLVSCTVAAGDAAPDFVKAMRGTFPGNPIHASAETVGKYLKSPGSGKTIAYVAADNNAGWVTYRPGKTRPVKHKYTKY